VQALVGGAWKAYSPYKAFSVSQTPTPQSPSGAISDTTPTYKWSKVAGATSYRYQLMKGATLVYTKTAPATACTTTACTSTPTTVLSAGAYKWRVQALVGGAWKPYSAYKAFSVNGPTSGFDSQFTSDAAGWTKLNGTWTVSGGSYQTPGLSGLITSAAHSNNYSTLTYEVRMRRTGCTSCVNSIYFRGSPNPITNNPSNNWSNGYRFSVSNDQYFQILYTQDGIYYSLLDWTYDPTSVTDGWNTLKVTANGTYMEFFINGVQVAYGNVSVFNTGQVGVGFYRSTTSTGDRLYVDWAKLSTTAPSSVAGGDGYAINGLGAPIDPDSVDDFNVNP
jgi:hypothetical protein